MDPPTPTADEDEDAVAAVADVDVLSGDAAKVVQAELMAQLGAWTYTIKQIPAHSSLTYYYGAVQYNVAQIPH